MEMKAIEIRDTGTCIGAIAWRFDADECDDPLLLAVMEHGGYSCGRPYVILTLIDPDLRTSYDPYQWNSSVFHVHRYLEVNWDEVKSGDVVDVRAILQGCDPASPQIFEEAAA